MTREKQRIHTAKTGVFLLAFLLVWTGGTEGIVLCFSTDGHIIVEAMLDGTCSDFSETSSRSSVHPSTIDVFAKVKDHCDLCVDIPLGQNGPNLQIIPIQTSSQNQQHKVSADSVPAALTFSGTATANLLSLTLPVADSTLTKLRTVFLLI